MDHLGRDATQGHELVRRFALLGREALIRAMYRPGRAPGARSRHSPDGQPAIKRILIIRPDHLGDLLFATPSLERIRQAFPEAHVTGLVGPWGRAMWQNNPNLDSLDVFPFPGITRSHHKGRLAPYRMLGQVARRLSRGRYDLGIVLRFDYWWGAAMLWAAGIPYTWGYNTPGMGSWLTNTVPYVHGRHEVEQNLCLTEPLIEALATGACAQGLSSLHVDRDTGEPALRPPPVSYISIELLEPWMRAPRRAVIHPGTAGANKLWTIEGWAEVACHLAGEGWAVALTGSPDEQPLAEAIVKAADRINAGSVVSIHNLAGRTTNIGQLVSILEQANIVLGVDSGPLHIADALGKRTLHLYGPSDERAWGPWGDPTTHRAFRAPETHPTGQLSVGTSELEGGPEMRAITPQMVIAEAHKLMGET